ncbi:MAG: DUF378 domain-containing protein [Rhodospirillales bacterium 69-11]|nr:DUF378 domain-containing protein [Rhodospirillales bacterium]OJW21394.1 MAG: DUF378 domain-containing protein [Rhodospirillales bacterium 69-11]
MRALNLVTLILVIVGGLNWGLIGLFGFNLVTAIFGLTVLTPIVYILVGLSALWQLVPLSRSFSEGEVAAERGYTAPGRSV